MVIDLCRGGELFDRICEKGNYFEKDAARIVKTIVDAVAYLHANGIVHRDLKPENLLFRTKEEDSDLLIADFGLSRIIDKDKYHLLTTTCGSKRSNDVIVFEENSSGLHGAGSIQEVWLRSSCGYVGYWRYHGA